MNKFITFEGVEGSGKSTQVKLLGEYLTGKNIPVLLTQEPSGTPIGRKIGDILFNRGHQAMCPETELLLFCRGARAARERSHFAGAERRENMFYATGFPTRHSPIRRRDGGLISISSKPLTTIAPSS